MPSTERILVINPNSTQAVTDGIDRAMEPLRMAGGPTIECVTLKEGPPGIETQAHVESVVAPISATVPATPIPASMRRARSRPSRCWASPSAAS